MILLQYKCTNMADWENASNNTKSRDVKEGYQPYQLVKCQVRVINEAGEGLSANASGHTACAGLILCVAINI